MTRPLWLLAGLCAFAGCQCTNSLTLTDRRDGGGETDAGSVDAGSVDAGTPACGTDGARCDGGLCAGGQCCVGIACGALCCGGAQLCSFGRCLTPGPPCRDTTECALGEYCDLSGSRAAEVDGGVCASVPQLGRCVQAPPLCAPDAGSEVGRSCVDACRFVRSAGLLRPEVKYAWGNPAPPYSSDVMMAPIVVQLDDDDCDGRITAQDQPDIVVVTFESGNYQALGTVRALTIKNQQLIEKWKRPGVIFAGSQLASGNIDGMPGNEIVGCGTTGAYALNGADGTTRWVATARPCALPSLADLEGDGVVEVITENQILDGRTGAVVRELPFSAVTTVTDVDGDGNQDIVSPAAISKADGTVLASVTGPAGYVAVGDLNRDGRPEIVSVDPGTHTLWVWSFDPTQTTFGRLIRSGIDINQTLSPDLCPAGSNGNLRGGGPPTVGDFNADGFPDVALAGGVGFAVFDGKKLMDGTPVDQVLLWIRQTHDCSSAVTGSTLFDFDGDGRVEAVYADELQLRIYDSATGLERFSTCNTSGTLIEYPLVADVDNDGQADLVVVGNAYAFGCPGTEPRKSGVRVFSSADSNWVVTRRVWNQHTYSVTNIEEDGTIPRRPVPNWKVPGLNNFRQNKQPGAEFAAADAVVSASGACDAQGVTYQITLRNQGEAPMPAGVRVELVLDPTGANRLLTTVVSSRVLGPLQAEAFSVALSGTELAGQPVVARITGTGFRQCRTDNDTSSPPAIGCIN